MTIARKVAFALAATVSFAGIAQAQTASSPSDYVKMAGAGDQYEIQSSRLVLKSTTDPQVKQFANKMISDHMNSTSMVKSAAMQDGMHPAPPMLDADGRMMLTKLTAAKGKARDQLYWSQQKMAHDKALALHQDYAANGTSAPLKAAAANIAPVVQQHEQMLSAAGAAM